MYGYIYKTTNLVNNLIYIGQKHSSTFLGQSYLGSGKLLRRAVAKYGSENFRVDLLEEVPTKEQMDAREIYWISFYRATDHTIGYNISEGGNVNRTMCGENNPFYKKTHSSSTVEKIRQANLGRRPWNKGLSKTTDTRIADCAAALKGRKATVKGTVWVNDGQSSKMIAKSELEEYKNNGWQQGRLPLPVENYKYIALGRIRVNNGIEERNIKEEELEQYLQAGWLRGRLKFKDTSKFGKHMCKPVVCIETGVIYGSVEEASAAYDCAATSISACCRHKRKTAGGVRWQYKEV